MTCTKALSLICRIIAKSALEFPFSMRSRNTCDLPSID